MYMEERGAMSAQYGAEPRTHACGVEDDALTIGERLLEAPVHHPEDTFPGALAVREAGANFIGAEQHCAERLR
jgi:hypothetical protein